MSCHTVNRLDGAGHHHPPAATVLTFLPRRAPAFASCAPDPHCPPVRRLTIFFWHNKANFMRKIWAKDSPQSELRISRYKGNSEGVESENAEIERDGSNIEGALAPPPPWKPWTRGETLLPSREEVKEEEEEEEGGPSPLLPVAPERCGGPSSSPRSSPTPPSSSPTSPSPPPLYLQRSTLPQPAVPST